MASMRPTARTAVRGLRALVWTGAEQNACCAANCCAMQCDHSSCPTPSTFEHMQRERRFAWMLDPVVQTLLLGLQRVAVNHTVSVGGGRGKAIFAATKFFGRGDLFVFVARHGLLVKNEGTSRALMELKQRGVHTVYYNGDPDDCLKIHALPVHEIWDYSWSTIKQCRELSQLAGRSLHTRYVPPGCVRGCQDRNATPPALAVRLVSGGAKLTMFGVGQARRVSCLRDLSMQLRTLQMARSVGQRRWQEQQDVEAPPPPPPLLDVNIVNHAWTAARLEHAVVESPLTLNLHKVCNDTRRERRDGDADEGGINADCETFRFAQMLSLGAHVLSEPCPAAEDEYEWRGLVHFAPFGSLAARAVALHSDLASGFVSFGQYAGLRSKAAARARHARFASSFDPARILERAGVFELARELSAAAGAAGTVRLLA